MAWPRDPTHSGLSFLNGKNKACFEASRRQSLESIQLGASHVTGAQETGADVIRATCMALPRIGEEKDPGQSVILLGSSEPSRDRALSGLSDGGRDLQVGPLEIRTASSVGC